VVQHWNAIQRQAPSIAVTGYGTDEDVRRCREAGFSDHITKPVNFDWLEALLEEMAKRVQTP
jgi:CheY-like chemotaxis protein